LFRPIAFILELTGPTRKIKRLLRGMKERPKPFDQTETILNAPGLGAIRSIGVEPKPIPIAACPAKEISFERLIVRPKTDEGKKAVVFALF
jgi:hypothetical protein